MVTLESCNKFLAEIGLVVSKAVTGLSVVIDAHQEALELIEPSLVSALVASEGHRVVLISQDDRDDLKDLANKYSVTYEVGPLAIVKYQSSPTLVLRPGTVTDPNYLAQVLKRGTPKSTFQPPTSSQNAIQTLRTIGQNLIKVVKPERRGYERRWERQNVSMKAWIAGIEGRCVDIHQHGGGFLIPRGNFAVGQRLLIELETKSVAGEIGHPKGVLTVRNVRPATGSGETWRIGGELEWDSAKELAQVIEHAFVVEKFINPDYVRKEVRTPVSIPATVAGHAAACIDLSEHGAAFQLTGALPETEEAVPIQLHLANGQTVKGDLKVRGVRQGQGAARISGLVFWENDHWLVENTKLLYKVNKS